MTLEDLGNVGDFVGGLAVIATLLYLAIQIRQNTRILRTSAEQGADPVAAIGLGGESPENAAVYHRGLANPEALAPEERTHFYLIMAANFYTLHQGFRATELGTQTEDSWNEWQLYALRFYLSQPGVRSWWRHQGHQLFGPTSGFRTAVEAELSKIENATA